VAFFFSPAEAFPAAALAAAAFIFSEAAEAFSAAAVPAEAFFFPAAAAVFFFSDAAEAFLSTAADYGVAAGHRRRSPSGGGDGHPSRRLERRP